MNSRSSASEALNSEGQHGFVRQLADHRLTLLLLVLVCGIWFDAFAAPAIATWLIVCAIGFTGWCALRNRPIASVCFLMISVAAVGGLRHHLCWRYFAETDIGFVAEDAGAPVCLKATIQDCPRLINAPEPSPLDTMPEEDTTRFRIWCNAVRNGEHWEKATGYAQAVVIGHREELRAGDRIQFFGRLVRPTAAMNPDEFDFRTYERAHRRLFRVSVQSTESITLLSHASPMDLRWYPQRLRGKCQDSLLRHLPRAQAELACAMLLGTRDYLSRSRREAFFYTGTIHLLAISGLHVGILASVFFVLLRRTNFCADHTLLILVSLLTLAYAIITEGKPPVMRASILIWIVCLARYFSRDGFALNSLSASALVILAFKPAQLFQVGFHLSFLAVIALFWLAPRLVPERKTDPLTKLIDKSRSGWERSIRSLGRKSLYWFAASLSIWCLTLPIAANGFHLISPIGLVLNVFLWFPVTVALFSGFGTLCFSWLPLIGSLLGWICSESFVCLESVVKWAEAVPGSYQWVAGPTDLTVGFFYVALSLVAFSVFLRRYSIQWMLGVAGVSMLVNWAQVHESKSELRCTFLSVGHGNCVVVELPNEEVWMYDAGSIAGPNFVVDAASQYLWRRRIKRLHKVIVSHADIDHFNGVPELLNRFHVDEVVCAPTMLRVDEAAVDLLKNKIASVKLPLRTVAEGDELISSPTGLRVVVLHPPNEGVEGSDNANSIVLSLAYANASILLTGDVEFAGLDRLIEQHQIDVDVAAAPHHGSPRSEPGRFLKWCTPEFVVISSGQQRDIRAACRLYQVPNLVNAFHTARDGAVTVVFDHGGIKLEPVRRDSVLVDDHLDR